MLRSGLPLPPFSGTVQLPQGHTGWIFPGETQQARHGTLELQHVDFSKNFLSQISGGFNQEIKVLTGVFSYIQVRNEGFISLFFFSEDGRGKVWEMQNFMRAAMN